MVRLREIPRTATFAWSPGAASPLIATGTRAGTVSADFSSETQLELWDLALDKPDQGVELQPVGSISADSRFHDIAWSQPSDARPRGIIAGAMESGALDLWDAEKLHSGSGDSVIERVDKHTGAIKAIQFNPMKHELLATAGAKGELYITDVNNINPFRLGTSVARADDFECLDWNKKVPFILATGSTGGFVTVWDLKTKKENLTLNNFGRKSVSAVAWDPDVPTRLMTAVPSDQDPLILMWDLRNSNQPAQVLKAHDQGVLSLSWCSADSDLLLSCGKDNRTICWNPHSGQALGEFPVVTNWTIQTKFNPHNPNLTATASFDGKIAIQTLQNAKKDADTSSTAAAEALDGEDFFNKAQSQPQPATFSLPQAPKWLKRPVGVAFGFGGKLVRFAPEAGSKQSKVSISSFVVDDAIGTATEKFEESLQKGDLANICEAKIAEAKTEEEKADWTVIETLISGQRKKLVEYLGFADAATAEKTEEAKESSEQANGTAEKDPSSFFDESGDGDNFLSDLAATKGVKTNNPFKIFTGEESEADKEITKALMLGSFPKALEICLKENRLSDAFMIAICGGQECIDKVQSAYFKKKSDGPNYLRLLASVAGKNLWDVVYNADLANWREVMATLCTFADASEFPDLCEALGDRLEESVQDGTDSSTLRKDASFCYLAGSKLEKVVGNWAEELKESETEGIEKSDADNSFSIHARSLQNFIEKVTIFREVTKFQDTDRQKTAEWKLAPLYAKYAEYADVVASHGQLKVAEKYLDLLPDQYPAADVARDRVKSATKKAAPQVSHQRTATTTTQRGQRVVPTAYQAATPAPMAAAQPPAVNPSPYAPMNAATPVQQQPYAPSNAAKGYTPMGYQPSGASIPTPVQQFGYGGYQPSQQQTPLPPPPRAFNSSPAVAPPSKATNMSAWNDLPAEFGTKPPVSRRGTPGFAGAITSPFPNQQPSMMSPPPAAGSPYMQQQRATPPPPPKGPPQGPPRTASPASAMAPPRPSSSAANAYAPPQQLQQQSQYAPPLATIPRGPSPYQPPPSAAPSSNRYAPAPGSMSSAPPSMVPPPRQVAPNPYASPMATPVAPPQTNAFAPPPAAAPPQGPPRAGPPPGGPPRASMSAAPPSRPDTAQSNRSSPAPVQAKYPPGDRSHIPPSAQSIFEILNSDMQRVKSKAPANFMTPVLDTEKRLNILFDHLNNEDLLKPNTVQDMVELSQHLQARNYDEAQALFTDLMKNKNDEGSNWMVGVKRLIQMSRATPV